MHDPLPGGKRTGLVMTCCMKAISEKVTWSRTVQTSTSPRAPLNVERRSVYGGELCRGRALHARAGGASGVTVLLNERMTFHVLSLHVSVSDCLVDWASFHGLVRCQVRMHNVSEMLCSRGKDTHVRAYD